MPAISRMGSGHVTPDYATIQEFIDAELNQTYTGVGPIVEVSGSLDLTATFQIRYGWSLGVTFRAAPGEEFKGIFGGVSHAKITGSQNIDVRVHNVTFSNLDLDTDFIASGADTFDNLQIINCGVRRILYLDRLISLSIKLLNTCFLLEAGAFGRVIYSYPSNVDIDYCTIVNLDPDTNYAAIYLRNNPTVNINNTLVYSPNSSTVFIHDTGVLNGDYNGGSDANLPGANNPVEVLAVTDFTNFSERDLRVSRDSVFQTAGLGGGHIGAFPEPDPTVVTIEGITQGALRPGDTIVIDLLAANLGGKTLSTSAGEITVLAQSAIAISFICPDPTLFGDKTLTFNTSFDLVVVDGGSSATTQIQVAPTVGKDFAVITEIGPMYTDLVAQGLAIGHSAYGKLLTGDVVVDPGTGRPAVKIASTYEMQFYDGVWGDVLDPPYSFQALDNFSPIASNQIFSVVEDVTNGAVVGNFVAEDSDGVIVSYSITGTALSIDSNAVITVADESLMIGGSSVVEDVIFTDDDGDSGSAKVTLNVSFIPPDILAPVISGPDDLNISIPVGDTFLLRDHVDVQNWLAQFTALDDEVGVVSVTYDLATIMLLSESPISIDFNATDGINPAILNRQIFITADSLAPIISGTLNVLISLPALQNTLLSSHVDVQDFIGQFSAVDSDSNALVPSVAVPASMNVADSPITVLVTATDSQSRTSTVAATITIDQLGVDSAPVISGPVDLNVTIPAGQTVLSRDHVTVQGWFSQFVAIDDQIGAVTVSHDIPTTMNLSDSPIVVTFSATDGVNSQVLQRQITIIENGGIAVSMGPTLGKYRIKEGGWRKVE